MLGHGDYHPACGQAIDQRVSTCRQPIPIIDPCCEAFLDRLFTAYRGMDSKRDRMSTTRRCSSVGTSQEERTTT